MEGDEAARVHDAFQAVVGSWSAVEVEVSRLYLAIEDAPYMHVDKESRTAATFDLVTGEVSGWVVELGAMHD